MRKMLFLYLSADGMILLGNCNPWLEMMVVPTTSYEDAKYTVNAEYMAGRLNHV